MRSKYSLLGRYNDMGVCAVQGRTNSRPALPLQAAADSEIASYQMVSMNLKAIVIHCGVVMLCLLVLSACSGNSDSVSNAVSDPLPQLNRHDSTFNAEHHAGGQNCATCHNDPAMTVTGDEPGTTRDVSIGTAWETSVMANSTRDPYWHAVVASELDNFPHLEDKINDECLVCHAPAAHDLASKDPNFSLRLFDKVSPDTGEVLQGIYSMDQNDELFNHAMDGVTCTVCHQMEADNFGEETSFTGGYVINVAPTRLDRPAYGPFDASELNAAYMINNAEFSPVLGTHLSDSASCATCHNLFIEPVDPQGNELPDSPHFAEQAIYTEWLNSDYSIPEGAREASCQSCHMPEVDEDVILGDSGNEARPDFSEHVFLGANTVMQDMLKNFAAELGIDPALDFDTAIARNREFLRGAADITLVQGTPEEGKLNFDVQIENLTGHKLPAGYHSRRVYLHVQVLDSNGQSVFESGRINADGSIEGVDEDINPATWEPHHDQITSPLQVQVYQSIVGNVFNQRTHSLLDGTQFLKDNRLTPIGYDKVSVNNDTTTPDSFGTFGVGAINDSDFNDGADTVSYSIDLVSGTYTVLAELRYQAISYGHIQKLFEQADAVEQVKNFRAIYNLTELRDEIIDSATQVMQ